MNKQKVVVIFNPAAKGEKARSVEDSLRSVAREVELWATDGPGQAMELARRAVAEGNNVVVAAGGDGTINEVVNGIAGSRAVLGVLPMGTMNVFAYELGLPLQQMQKCWEVIEQGKVKEIDLPLANDQFFVQLAGVGLDAQAVEATAGSLRRSIGPLSYLVSAAQVLGQPPPRLEVVWGNGQRFEASFVLIGNGRHYGGPFPVFAQAANNDGLLDVLAFRNQGYADMFRFLQGLLLGKPEQVPDIEYLQTASVAVSSNEDTPVEVDGEVSLRTPVRFGLSPQRLRVLVP